VDIHVLTLFPEMFPGVLDASIMRIARESGRLRVHLHNLRDHADDRHRSVDDRPFGGGPGMVLKPEPVFRAVEAIEAGLERPPRRVLLTPQGRTLSQGIARELAAAESLLLICGHYEGFDERIRIGLRPEELSIGDYVLTGGELAALVVIDAVARLVEGVLGHEQSAEFESFSRRLLDHPQYTRPVEFRGMRVPEVLLTGDHERIAAWRRVRALERTRERRRDLLETSEFENESRDRGSGIHVKGTEP
jgi:tRNA (guanine37-N1)-methyltransferase